VLYSNVSNDLDKQVRSAAKELLIAAWYYLSERYSLDELKQEAALLKQYAALSDRLFGLLEWSDDAKDKILFRRVEQILIRLENNHSEGIRNE